MAKIMIKTQYGQRLLPVVLDELAKTKPDNELISIPRSTDAKDGWRKITNKQFADAVDRFAGQLLQQCQNNSTNGHRTSGSDLKTLPDSFPTTAYIGPSDARYIIFTLACIKAGQKALFISPRNSHDGQMNLFDKTNCNTIYYDADFEPVVAPWVKERGMRAVKAAPQDEWWLEGGAAATPTTHVPYTKTWDEAKWDPAMVLHTSGSTGLPKPIVVRAGMLAQAERFKAMTKSFNGRPTTWDCMSEGRRTYVPMPLFHAAGMYTVLMGAVYNEHPVALGIPGRPFTPQSVLDAIEHADVDTLVLAPAILEEMVQMPEAIEGLKKVGRVLFGGGKLNPEAGDRLARETIHVTSVIGYTEAAPLPYYDQPNLDLWEWFIIDSKQMGCDWRFRDTDADGDVYEQFIVRKTKPGEEPTQAIFFTFPDLDEYPTKDLYVKHPTLPDHWKYHGRADDVIVFSNGEKLNPVSIENIVGSHPDMAAALVVGAGRFQPALILEPRDKVPEGEAEEQKFIDKIWPLVLEANKVSVAHGQIERQFITFTRPGKPFPRAGKGTVQRAGAVKLYSEEIEALYQKAGQDGEAEANTGPQVSLNTSCEESLAASLQDMYTQLGDLKAKGKTLGLDTDLFAAGVDSLQVINSGRMMKRFFGPKIAPNVIVPRAIYANPTPRQLASYLLKSLGAQTNAHTNGQGPDPDIQAMKDQLEKYTHDLPTDPTAQKRKQPPSIQGQTIILTGSTGALGSYLLDMLQASPAVRSVVCLNRGDDSAARQAKASAERGLPSKFPKAEFYGVDLSREKFGLPTSVYTRLLRETDRVIHNAWPVNFNMSVETFEPHIRGVRNLVDFSVQCTRRVPVVFLSTIGTMDRWAGDRPVPEHSLDDLTLPTTGYGQSKLVSSLILDRAMERSGVPTAVVRVGQVAGPRAEKGVWNRQEWFPSLVASSLFMGVLPDNIGPMQAVNWVPIEDMAKLLLEVAGVLPARDEKISELGDGEVGGYFHGVNHRTVDWGKLVGVVKEFYGERIKKIVSLEEWVHLLEHSAAGTGKDIERNLGVKLLDFYQGLVGAKGIEFDLKKTIELSKTMAELEAVTPALLQNWCRQWGF